MVTEVMSNSNGGAGVRIDLHYSWGPQVTIRLWRGFLFMVRDRLSGVMVMVSA